MPAPFTPSINQTLEGSTTESAAPRSLPDGMTAGLLKSRLDGKKKIKGAILTPQEMKELTEHWKPYRSIGKS
ncbi:hypothetical protein EWM64_g6977 [Hericium alpestre]|uniref:Uncharacterized protein n=1 Tax=Hericium alpestre TaxID=135208 RepID=A0A4Y9ZRY4_9AGAM|nr:hypothetical protein EWM64_g6977 [Hericium alpestre]